MMHGSYLKIFVSITAVVTLTLSTAAHAQTTTTCAAGTSIIHVNGINTGPSDGNSNLQALRSAVNLTQTPDGKPVNYYLVYNPDNRFFRDLSEAALSWIDQDPGNRGILRNFMVQLTGAVLDGTFDTWYLVWALPNSLREGLLEFFRLEIPSRVMSSYQRNEAVEASVRTRIENEVLTGNKVVLVPHSQGNFMVNDATAPIAGTTLASAGVIGVAVPADHVGTAGMPVRQHVTRTGDLLMAPIPGRLPANVSDALCLDTLGHSFAGCYLKEGTLSRSTILGHINSAISSIPFPNAGAGAGAISVTLRWGAQPDVDLHVFEPNGAHVYYANLVGPSGRLDLDDTSGFGPENYFVACNKVEVGSYRVGVNYYSGSGPETAQVAVRAGTIDRNFSQLLTTAVGSTGNASPIPVSTIDVTQQGGQFVFNVR